MNQFIRRVLFFLFFLSGFSSLVYQVVWTRMAFASFGIITPVLSVVLSVFMLGLAVGSWAGGRFVAAFVRKTGLSAAIFYALAELLIGLGAFAVPKLFAVGENILLASGETNSFGYLSLSALVLAASILPWCVCMGATFPLMMAYVRERDRANTESFSFLYLANVLGAMSGTFLTAVVYVEVLGFHHTLWLAAAGNFTIAAISGCLGWAQRPAEIFENPAAPVESSSPQIRAGGMTKAILFSTGFVAMAMEVIWSRAFAPTLKTQVYSFAMIVFAYLGATFFGSWMYRRDLRKNRRIAPAQLIFALALTAFLPVLANNPRFVVSSYWTFNLDLKSVIILLGSICPFCALLGYLTPGLVDEYASGQPRRAGQAYAINVLGCILGPLFACYILLPQFSERYSLILLTLAFIAFAFALRKSLPQTSRLGLGLAIGLALVWSSRSEDFEKMLFQTTRGTTVRRDYTASVISFEEGDGKWLLVNGIGMTKLTPITKFIADLPLAFHKDPPKSALVICFGMGTTFRSALSWDIDTTAVELVPSVTKAFGFYHADAARCVNDPNAHIIIDDGRRYLKRTTKKFDVIVVDPPPPVEAAGSSLLFSREFYTLAKQHLNPGGILQMWYPGDDDRATTLAVFRSIYESFPYVRCFPSVEGWGVHLVASMEPIEPFTAQQLAARMPEAAKQDLVECSDSKDVPAYLARVVNHEFSIFAVLDPDPKIQVTDDQPYNEYFLLRRLKKDPSAN
jgi:spermidine synthase/MFS family permease